MNLPLGIYEIFSRIIPGGLYMAAIVQFLSVAGIVDVDLTVMNDVSLAASIGLLVVAYVLGGAFDVFSLGLFRLFKKPGSSGRILAQFKKDHQDRWQIDFNDRDWPVLLAFIRTQNLELAGQLDRHNALSIMLRNVSLGLLFMAINSLIQLFLSRNPIYLLLFVIMLGIALLIIRQSIKFRAFFYSGIYETVLAYRIDLESAIKPVHSGARQSKVQKE